MGQRIDVNHENIYYGDFLAVEDVNINIEPNKVTAFIGPSGCGKSTVLRTLDRMHEIIPGAHVEGEVLLEGKNQYDKDVDPVAVRRDVGMVIQPNEIIRRIPIKHSIPMIDETNSLPVMEPPDRVNEPLLTITPPPPPEVTWLLLMLPSSIVKVLPSSTYTPPPLSAVLPAMLPPVNVTVPPPTYPPPP